MQDIPLSQTIRHGLFGDRETLEEAMLNVYAVALASDSNAQVIAAVHVFLNTLANEMDKEQA